MVLRGIVKAALFSFLLILSLTSISCQKSVAQLTDIPELAVVDIYWNPQNIPPGTSIYAVEFYVVLKNVGTNTITRDAFPHGLLMMLDVGVASGWPHMEHGERGEPFPRFSYIWGMAISEAFPMYQGQQVTFRTT